ncbi:MotA/TolQ/ExbB proton channel family protein [Roseibacillus ishigakijimensis]|uniref:MotA/TolQ/ExbB proton channel family protein n=1 Tax=Roseibacillus ishigakijimensis TaxID=454146 RepID=A0A934RQP1_9BACT|nr:MotA/TolQ/ExbB proton channel family protein [Roseibacillus ishigakijimensis]MBK1834117.1 MotA/TolQ/ExbB proton channel family protein [Roseibacillus ishigakijimensis]
MNPLLAASYFDATSRVWDFLVNGGPFMAAIALCSIVALAVTVMKLMTLRKEHIIPDKLAGEVERFDQYLENDTLGDLEGEFRAGQSALSRLCSVAVSNAGRSQIEVQEAVQSSAREEIVKLNGGLPVLEVVITIAPLLGLLGTASGLVLVFRDFGADADYSQLSKGIAMALSTTIAGLAVAVPSVIAHSYFSRQIETMAARLEVVLSKVVSACHQHVFFKRSQG